MESQLMEQQEQIIYVSEMNPSDGTDYQLQFTVVNPMILNSSDSCFSCNSIPTIPMLLDGTGPGNKCGQVMDDKTIIHNDVDNINATSSPLSSSPSSPPSSTSSSSSLKDPFRPECLIPLPGCVGDGYFGLDSRTFVRRRNERERTRVRNVNDGFERLRQHLPYFRNINKEKRLSKVETLREAINYIKRLQTLLDKEIEKQ